MKYSHRIGSIKLKKPIIIVFSDNVKPGKLLLKNNEFLKSRILASHYVDGKF